MFDDINSHKYLSLIEIGETDSWYFRIVVAEAIVVDNSSLVAAKEIADDSLEKILNESNPIEVTESSKRYEIVFKDYISYVIINESFIDTDKNEKYEGKLARKYTQSAFLEYVAKCTFATSDFPGPFEHYGFICLDHIIHIATLEAPEIRILNI